MFIETHMYVHTQRETGGNCVLEMARTLGLAMWLLPNLPQIPRLLATRIDITIFCLVPSIAASQARRSSPSSALDFAISIYLSLFQLFFELQLCEERREQRTNGQARCEKVLVIIGWKVRVGAWRSHVRVPSKVNRVIILRVTGSKYPGCKST